VLVHGGTVPELPKCCAWPEFVTMRHLEELSTIFPAEAQGVLVTSVKIGGTMDLPWERLTTVDAGLSSMSKSDALV
jgi:hypothetical protein